MRILGIDPGSEITGYGFIETDGNTHHLMDYGAIRTNVRKSFSTRLLHIYEQLVKLIGEHKPDVVALEDMFYAVNVKSALKLGHTRGVALLAAAQAGLAIYEYSPLEVKSAVAGYGRADKQQVQKMVQMILRLPAPPQPNDVSDALAVAICHAHHLNPRICLNLR
jgi:crossover junction endodeoxyribonuclease RuvC